MAARRHGKTGNPNTATAEEEELLKALRQIIRAVDVYSRRLASSARLTGPQLLCLRELRRSGPLCSGALATQLCLSPATVTGILDRMEARGLVTRRREAPDKRKVTVSLTPQGRRALRAAPEPLQEDFLRQFRCMSSREQSQMVATLQRIVTMMDAEGIAAEQPMLADVQGEPFTSGISGS